MARRCAIILILSCIFYISLSESQPRNSNENLINYKESDIDFTKSPFKKCHNSSPPLTASNYRSKIPLYVVNLDLPPEERWKELVTNMKPRIHRLAEIIHNHTDEIFGLEIFHIIDNFMPYLTQTLPKEYYHELIGISNAIDLSIGEITVFNVFYEFHSLCTSIVMQDDDGKMYHGRNLDFGLFLGWDIKNKTWLVSELLRPLVVEVEFQRNQKTLYTSINFAGYIGILTGIKKNMFSLSVNERFKLNGGFVGLIEWILGRRNQKWNGILTREVMENATNYDEARKMLTLPKLLAPSYFILTGNKSYQGCIITRGRNDVDLWDIGYKSETGNSSWYLVQTNYDHWKRPPAIDNRRTPAMICLELLGRNEALYSLYNVLSTVPVLNKLTVYTAIMNPSTGDVKTWLQDCGDPCWPW